MKQTSRTRSGFLIATNVRSFMAKAKKKALDAYYKRYTLDNFKLYFEELEN